MKWTVENPDNVRSTYALVSKSSKFSKPWTKWWHTHPLKSCHLLITLCWTPHQKYCLVKSCIALYATWKWTINMILLWHQKVIIFPKNWVLMTPHFTLLRMNLYASFPICCITSASYWALTWIPLFSENWFILFWCFVHSVFSHPGNELTLI